MSPEMEEERKRLLVKYKDEETLNSKMESILSRPDESVRLLRLAQAEASDDPLSPEMEEERKRLLVKYKGEDTLNSKMESILSRYQKGVGELSEHSVRARKLVSETVITESNVSTVYGEVHAILSTNSDECDDPTDNTVSQRLRRLIAHVKTVDPKKAQLLTAERKRNIACARGKRKIVPTSK